MSKKDDLKPGQPAPRSGQYQIIGPRGGHGPERTVVRREPLPPTPAPGLPLPAGRPDPPQEVRPALPWRDCMDAVSSDETAL